MSNATSNSSSTLRGNRSFLPKRIILVRHGQSTGNHDSQRYIDTPDNKMQLTEAGKLQSFNIGKQLKDIVKDEPLRVFVSPYIRARQTFREIAKSLSPDQYLVYEEPRLREQEWGVYKSVEEVKRCVTERRRVGSFYYRFPNGESGADVYDRISTFLSSMFRDFQRHATSETNYVLVSHGLAMKLFLMRWFRWSVERFHRMHPFHNCQMVVLERQANGSYKILGNPLSQELTEAEKDNLCSSVDPDSPFFKKNKLRSRL